MVPAGYQGGLPPVHSGGLVLREGLEMALVHQISFTKETKFASEIFFYTGLFTLGPTYPVCGIN